MKQITYRTLRGAINLKLCVLLGLGMIAAFFIAGSRAAVKSGCASCETSPQSAITSPAKAAEQPAAIQPTPALLFALPEGIEAEGTVSGQFAGSAPLSPKQELNLAQKTTSRFQTEKVYNFDLTLHGKQAFQRVQLSVPNTKTVGAKQLVLFSAFVGSPVKNISIKGTLKGEALVGKTATWSVLNAPTSPEPELRAGHVVNKYGAKIKGTIDGLFVDFDTSKVIRKTLDVTDTGDYGPTADIYDVNVLADSRTQNLHAFALANANTKDTFLSVVVDTPVSSIRLHGNVEGTRFSNSGIGWGIVTSDDVRQLQKQSRQGMNFQAPINLAAWTAGNKTRFRSLEYTTGRDNPEVQQVGLLGDIFRAVAGILPGKIRDIFQGKHAIDAQAFAAATTSTVKNNLGEVGPTDACDGDKTVTSPEAGREPGWTVHAQTNNSNAGVNVLNDWLKEFTPQSFESKHFPYTITKGSKNVTVKWVQEVVSSNPTVLVRYARNGDDKNQPIDSITYILDAVQYLEPNPTPLNATPCPTPTPTATATPKPEPTAKNTPTDEGDQPGQNNGNLPPAAAAPGS